MRKLLILTTMALGLASLSVVPASARNYDCTKAGNASKTECKSAAASAAKLATKSAPMKAMAPKAAAIKISSSTTTKTLTERTFDCTKAGNKNKAVCKSSAAPSAPVVKQTTTATATRHYDCTKPGNANKEACKVSTTSQQTVSKPVATPRAAPPVAAPRATTVRPAAATAGAAGATAMCKDGTYSHAKQHSGACSRHGGVANWL